MVMWIILGVLAVVVLGIIMVMAFLDRKKAAKIKVERIELQGEMEKAKLTLAEDVIKTVKANKTKLDQFVPSVGKLKMADIRDAARESLKIIEHSRSFKLANENADEDQELILHFNNLKHMNSNLWVTKGQDDIKYFEDLIVSEKKALTNAKDVSKKTSSKKFFKRKK